MGIKVITPAVAQMTSEDLRLHARIDTTAEDDLLDAWILEAQAMCQHLSGRAIGTQTLELALDAFPSGSWRDSGIDLPLGPVTAVTSVKYIDQAGAEQTLPTSVYSLDDYGVVCRLVLTPGSSWPATTCGRNMVKVRYVAGFFPPAARTAVSLIVAHRYENREASTASTLNEIPMGVAETLEPIKSWAMTGAQDDSEPRWRG